MAGVREEPVRAGLIWMSVKGRCPVLEYLKLSDVLMSSRHAGPSRGTAGQITGFMFG